MYCRIRFSWNDFEIDQFIAQILAEAAKRGNGNEVRIDPSSGCWEIVDSPMNMCQQQSQQRSPPFSKNSVPLPQSSSDVMTSRSLKRTGENEGATGSGLFLLVLMYCHSLPFCGNSYTFFFSFTFREQSIFKLEVVRH